MTNYQSRLDLSFHALSDSTRRAVVSRLADGEQPVAKLAEPFDMALPSFTQHLKVLEDCGLITSEKRGRSRWCRLMPAHLQEVANWIDGERRRWERNYDQLEAYLAAQANQEDAQ